MIDFIELNNNLISKIKGFLDIEEGICLYNTALEASKIGPCLEIGSYCGKSAIYLGLACKENKSALFSIDHHKGSEEQQAGQEYFDPELFDSQINQVNTFRFFKKTLELADLENYVIPIVANSSLIGKFWYTPLSLVFIDGGHSYKAAYTDYNLWSVHIKYGGYLLFHDIFDNPKDGGQAPYQVYLLALKSGLFREVKKVKSLVVLKRE